MPIAEQMTHLMLNNNHSLTHNCSKTDAVISCCSWCISHTMLLLVYQSYHAVLGVSVISCCSWCISYIMLLLVYQSYHAALGVSVIPCCSWCIRYIMLFLVYQSYHAALGVALYSGGKMFLLYDICKFEEF